MVAIMERETINTNTVLLDPDQKSPRAQEFEEKLAARIVGQERAVRRMSGLYQIFLAGMNPPNRPVGTMLFLGPTGSGKTRVVEAAAEVLFGDPNAVIKIDCAEFQHSHEIAKLIGSPPGYLGHRETSPMLTQENLDRYHTEESKLSLVLFDEIEKASDSLWQLLLGILDKATLTLGDNRRVDFSQDDGRHDLEPRRARDVRADLGRHRLRPQARAGRTRTTRRSIRRFTARRSRRRGRSSRRSS